MTTEAEKSQEYLNDLTAKFAATPDETERVAYLALLNMTRIIVKPRRGPFSNQTFILTSK